MKILKHLLPALLLLLTTVACNHRYYAPNTIQMPNLKYQHDATVSGGLASGPEYKGFELQAVYSPIKHVAVMGNAFFVKGDVAEYGDNPELNEWGNGRFAEFGIGAYYNVGSKSVGSIISGYGVGNVYNEYGLGRFADLNFRRFFIQSSLNTQYRFLNLGFGVRMCHLNYTSGVVDFKIETFKREVIDRLLADSPMWLPEYAFSFGLRVFDAFLLKTILTYTPSNSAQKDARFAGSNLQTGISIDLQQLFKKK